MMNDMFGITYCALSGLEARLKKFAKIRVPAGIRVIRVPFLHQ
jgi:hypothetical protein